MMADHEDGSFFCGRSPANQSALSNDVISTFTFSKTLENHCYINYLYIWPHVVIPFVLLLTLLYKWTWGRVDRSPNYGKGYQMTFPLERVRCSVFLCLLAMHVVNLGEGIVTDSEAQPHLPTQPQLYLPPLFAMVATLVAMLYYQKLEVWNKPGGLGFLLLQWVWSIAVEFLRLQSLIHIHGFNLDVMRILISATILVIYAGLILIECYVFIYKSRLGRDNLLKDIPEDLLDEDFRYFAGYTNLYSSLMFSWMNPIFRLGQERQLELNDLGGVAERFKSEELYVKMENEIQRQKQQSLKQGRDTSVRLYPILIRRFGVAVLAVVLMRLVIALCDVIKAHIIKLLLDYVNNIHHLSESLIPHNVTVEEFFHNGFVLAVLLGAIAFSFATLYQCTTKLMLHIAVPARSSIQAVVYHKAMRLSTNALNTGEMSKGKISNMISVDPTQILTAFIWFPQLFSTLLMVFNIAYLIQLLGPPGIICIAAYILVFPIQAAILYQYSKIRMKSMAKADQRLKVTNETLQGIKVVKLFGWESIFLQKILTARDEQMQYLKQGIFVGGLLVPAGTLGSTIAMVLSLGTYSLFNDGYPLTPDVAFPAMVLLLGINQQIVQLPSALRLCINGHISIRRIEKFLSCEEIENKVHGRGKKVLTDPKSARKPGTSSYGGDTTHDPQYGSFQNTPLLGADQEEEQELVQVPVTEISLTPDVAIKINDGTFTWENENGRPTLHGIDIEIPAGKLTMVVGEVGSGKSSLIAAMLGEMKTITGQVIWNRDKNSAAYADQKAWLRNATLRDNIIFDHYEGDGRYKDVVEYCALLPDISILPAGDETEIGEKGINLSGGQKQRINVSRALYSKSDIVILDDPLSALDSHVGAQVFKDGIQMWLGGEKRTVILVTHQLKNIEEADNIIVMKNGTVYTQGSPDLIRESNPELWATWQDMLRVEGEEERKEQAELEKQEREERLRLIKQISEQAKEERYRRMSSVSSVEGDMDIHVSELTELHIKATEEEDSPNRGKLIQIEDRQSGAIGWWVYFQVAVKAGVLPLFALSAYVLAGVASACFNQFWLNTWSQAGQDAVDSGDLDSYDNAYYTIVYSLFSLMMVVTTLFGGLVIYWMILVAGMKLHNSSIGAVIRSPLRFFDVTPSGRIMNRFSSDLALVDQNLGLQITIFMMTALAVVTGIIINIFVAQYFVIIILPFFYLFIYITKYYLTSTREMKRVESITISPLFNHFSETVTGLSTIRAYAYQKQFADASFYKIDQCANVTLFRSQGVIWLSTRLALTSNVLFVSLGIILIGMARGSILEAGAVGVALTSIMTALANFSTIVNSAAEVEMSMNAVERLISYESLPPEEYDGIVDPPNIWPDQGEIVLDRLWARYDTDLDPVLRNVSLTLKPHEKVGICGRTGSGKSSLTLALFRIVDIFSGDVYIDGMNVKHIPLTKLRQKLAIVPQDPVLFTGSIRFNLDPFDKIADEKLWEALEIAQLKNVVGQLDGTLDATVSEGGENFSVGQRQLFCLARAFLRNTKILIMDEATASIDMETDAILQKIVASAFHEMTVLTIAHRTATILDSDRVVVLDEGRVAELDSPARLLKRESIFASLVQQNK